MLEEYDENGNPLHVLSSNVVYSGDHVTGPPHHGITSQHISHPTTSSTEPYSQYTDENVFELQEYEEFEPPPQVTLAYNSYNQQHSTAG